MTDKALLHIASSQRLSNAYRALLTSDWPDGHTAAVNELIRDLLKVSRVLVSFQWEERAARAPRSASRRIAVPPNAAPYVQAFIERFDVNLPRVPGQIPHRQDAVRSRLSREALMATFFLSLQSRFRLDGDVGFLTDCQSLLFSSVVHVLWPKPEGRGMKDEQHLLLSYLWMHTIVAWEEQPSHKYFLTRSWS